MDEKEKQAVHYLRQHSGNLLTPKYDTDFNLLRWAIGYGFDLDEALIHLIKHLKLRRFHNLDDSVHSPGHTILDKYFPIGIIGETGKDDNTLLVAECAGRIDLKGILKTVQLSHFLYQRYCFQERVLDRLNEMERRRGQQASVVYILDLEGLKLDSWLLSVVTGPYRILWASVYTNYPEWISSMIIVNCPPFMSLIWKAIHPLLPERTRNKIRICSTMSEAKNCARSLVSPSHLPCHWGGNLINNKAADIVISHRDPIPSTMYWKPDEESPDVSKLTNLIIPAGKSASITYTIKSPSYFVINRFCDRTYGMTVFYHSSFDESINTEEMIDWSPFFEYPGMPTVDRLRERCLGPGTIRVQFHNEQAWIRSLEVYYRVVFEDEMGNEIPFISHDMIIS